MDVLTVLKHKRTVMTALVLRLYTPAMTVLMLAITDATQHALSNSFVAIAAIDSKKEVHIKQELEPDLAAELGQDQKLEQEHAVEAGQDQELVL
jgi:hypothetical protein